MARAVHFHTAQSAHDLLKNAVDLRADHRDDYDWLEAVHYVTTPADQIPEKIF